MPPFGRPGLSLCQAISLRAWSVASGLTLSLPCPSPPASRTLPLSVPRGSPSPAHQPAASHWAQLSSELQSRAREPSEAGRLGGWEAGRRWLRHPHRLGNNACPHCDVLSVFCFTLCVRCLCLPDALLFQTLGGREEPEGGAQRSPSPAERRDRSLKAQGPIPSPPCLSLTPWDWRATPQCYWPSQFWKRQQGASPA